VRAGIARPASFYPKGDRMDIVSSITLDKEGHPTTGAGDVLIGDRAEHVRIVFGRLVSIARDKFEALCHEQAEAIVDAHTIVAPGDPLPAPVVEPVEPVEPVEFAPLVLSDRPGAVPPADVPPAPVEPEAVTPAVAPADVAVVPV